MKRRLFLLNVLLVAAVAGLAWELRVRWMEARAREQQLLKIPLKPVVPAPLPPAPVVGPAVAASYAEVAQKMLFTKDRNPNVEVIVEPPKVMPPLPAAFGVMTFGEPMVILSEKPGGEQRGYKVGERIGPFKLLAFDRQKIVFEWDGKKVERSMEELLNLGLRQQPVQAADAAAAAAPPPPPAQQGSTTVLSGSGSGRAEPGKEMGGGTKACQPGDNAAAGTVTGGMKKVVSQTPFGSTCYWEPVK